MMKSIGTKGIKTKRLLLRRFTLADEADLYNHYGSDLEVQRYINYTPCATIEGTKQFLQMHVEQYETNPDFYGWAIVYEDLLIGSIALFDVKSENDQAEIGYSIGSKWWGMGIVSEAAEAVLRYAFDEIGVHRVIASHHIDNIASGKVMKKIGMKYEGTLRDGQKNADGSFSDLCLYAKLATD